jgi:hypothetical protein
MKRHIKTCWANVVAFMKFEFAQRTEVNIKIDAPQAVEVMQMAYLRKEKETVEIDYPLSEVWAAISEALASLEWTLEQIDDVAHHAKVKTKAAFMSYSSRLTIDGVSIDEKTSRVTVEAETPVTTITAITDFGRTKERIQLFFETLARRLKTHEKS